MKLSKWFQFSTFLACGVFTACTTTGDDAPVYRNSEAKKLSGEEVRVLVVGKQVIIPRYMGTITHHKDGRYVYETSSLTFRGTYRIQGDMICSYDGEKRGVCANYFLLNNQYYWSNVKSRKNTAVIESITDIEQLVE